jgi:hypothetical protein
MYGKDGRNQGNNALVLRKTLLKGRDPHDPHWKTSLR